MIFPCPLILFLFSLTGIIVGLILALKPAWAIEAQRRFYAKINWRIEPISMEKELLNSRLMGYFLIVLSIATLLFVLFLRPSP
jgi:hypothetical protein